ncbi:hypothetical protein L915_16850 [Phytophthora nicotianae]|uniref:Uncharacterized protein n=1 Tax=Phytophthora nicotianae TaxID=4792 RepID=W2G1A7_PHYNI|nr:hypothetical protein L915_16850 [Phytophthora nicotianae]
MSSTLRITEQAIQEDAAVRHSDYKSSLFSFMHSRPGGADQEPHQDYTAEPQKEIYLNIIRGNVFKYLTKDWNY